MDYSVQRLQFLDLTDATENDQSLIERVLFSSDQALEVPWYTRSSGRLDEQGDLEWGSSPYSGDVESRPDLQSNNPVQNAENESDQCGGEEEQDGGNHQEHSDQIPQQDQIPRQGGIFPGHPPTSVPHQAQPMFQMYQMLPSLSNVYVSNVTANVNVHAPYVQPIPTPYGHQIPPQQQQPPQQMFSHGPPEAAEQGSRSRRQRQKTDKKREGPFVQANEVISPSLDGHPPPQFPNIPPMPSYYLPGAPGAPMYMQHPILPVYPSPMFNPYGHTPGHMVYPQTNNLEPESEEYHENVQQNFHQGGSEMVVVGCPIRSESGSVQRREIEVNENNYQIEELQEQVLQDPGAYKPISENVQMHGEEEENAENSIGTTFVPQQNGEHFENLNEEKGGVSCCEKPEQEMEKNSEKTEQTAPYANTRKEDSRNFHAEGFGKVSQKKKTNGELDVNNVDKVSVNSRSSDADWANEEGGSSTVNQNITNHVKLINSAGVQVMKVQETPMQDSHQNTDFPLIGQNVKLTRTAFASTEPEAAVPSQVTPSSGGKSWASLFNSSNQFTINSGSDNRGRPLARVLPYHEVDNSNSSLPQMASALPNAQAAGAKDDNVSSVKVNGPLCQDNVPNSNFKNDPYLYNLGAFLCNYELEHRIVSLLPRGLTNRSNWCYVNAILQALIACPPFYNLMKALPAGINRKGNKQTLIVDAMVEYANEFSPIPANARIGKREKSARNKEENSTVEILTGPAFEPSGIYKILDKVRGESSFNIEGRQEDAEEFLSCLLNGLNDEMFELMKMAGANKLGLANGDANGLLEGTADDDDSEWNVMGPKNKSSVTRRAVCGKTPISDIFRGQFRSRVQRAGDHSTDTVQPFFTLQLDIEKANSVKDALELFMGKDPLEGVTCTKTHQEVEAWTQTTLEDLPLVLILHLKCYDYKLDACSKIIKSFDFQVDLKIDAKLLSNRNKYTGKQRNYKLVAVVYHDGKEASKGHYVTDAYHVGYGCWLRYDDVIVRSVPESHVLKPRAPRVPYLLYYRRADTIGPTK